jgi:hypothetical protein
VKINHSEQNGSGEKLIIMNVHKRQMMFSSEKKTFDINSIIYKFLPRAPPHTPISLANILSFILLIDIYI